MSFKEFQLDGFTYRSNKPLILITFLLILAYALFCFNYSGWTGKTYYYTECPNNTMTGSCLNAYYQSNLCSEGKIKFSDPLCSEKYIAEGQSLGEKAPWFIQDFNLNSVLLLILALVLNTFLFNKGFFKYVFNKLRGLKNE